MPDNADGDGHRSVARLDADDRRLLLEVSVRRKYARGEVVFHEGDAGDAIYLIDRGTVAIRVTTPLGDVVTFAVLRAGETFGEGALIADDARRTAAAVALEAVETRIVRRSDFSELCRRQPSINQFLIDVLAAQVRRLSAHLVEALYVPADSRVLRRVAMLCEIYGSDGTPTIPPQDDIAAMAGTTRPTANRVLKAAEDEGIVRLARGRVEVLDLARLARKAR